MDYTNAKRIFIFVYESGDSGDFTNPSSSDYFIINVLLTTDINMREIEKMLFDFRFYTGYTKELKYLQKEHINLFIKLFYKIIQNNYARYFSLEIEKSSYIGPYLKSIEKDVLNPNKFRNFLLKKTLEHITTNEDLQSKNVPIEIIIDRYIHNQELEQNLKEYLWSNYKLPNFDAIVQVDSRYCHLIQLIDIIQKFQQDNVHSDVIDLNSLIIKIPNTLHQSE